MIGETLLLDTLKMLNKESGEHSIIESLLDFLRERLDVEAAAVRLCQGNGYPYFISKGFAEEFVEQETKRLHSICGVGSETTAMETPFECLCRSVYTGDIDSTQPYFTEAGSFWTSESSVLLNAEGSENWRKRTRELCNSRGYESVSIIPIKVNDETIGLLQLNDTRSGRFDEKTVELLETVCNYVGIAIIRSLNEERKREQIRLQSIMELTGQTCHDINQPLQVILGNTELIINDIIEQNSVMMDTCLEEIHEQALRIRELTVKMQEYTGYRSRRSSANQRPVDLNLSASIKKCALPD